MEPAIFALITSASNAMISNIGENAKNQNFLVEILLSTTKTKKNMPKMRRRNLERWRLPPYVMPTLQTQLLLSLPQIMEPQPSHYLWDRINIMVHLDCLGLRQNNKLTQTNCKMIEYIHK